MDGKIKKIKPCEASAKQGHPAAEKLLEALEFPLPQDKTYPVALTDELLLKHLPAEQLAQVCKDTKKQSYYLSTQALETLRGKLDPKSQPLQLPEGAEKMFLKKIQDLIANPPKPLEQATLNTNEYVVTSMRLDPFEVAMIRDAIEDSPQAEASLLKRIPNPLYGPEVESAPARYAFSTKVDATRYDKILFTLSQFLGDDNVPAAIQARVTLLQNEIQELKAMQLRKRAPERPLVIPDSYFGTAEKATSARETIAKFMESPPKSLSEEIDLDDYTLFRKPLFASDVAFLRWSMKDSDNSLFVNYNGPLSTENNQAQAFYIRRDIDWEHYIATLAVLESHCHTGGLDGDLCNRVGAMVREAERIDQKVKQESFSYKTWDEGLPVGIGFAGASAMVGAGAALIKYIVTKGGPKGPPPPPGGGPSGSGDAPPKSGPRSQPRTEEQVEFRGIQWGEGAATLGWGLATVGAGALTVVAGLGTGVAIACPADGPALDIALGAGTVKSAVLTAGAASLFIISAQNFLKSVWE
jgi:hypothetical protein